jgi:hypothetical protein
MALGEWERWASDYSRESRRAMTSRLLTLRADGSGQCPADKPVPRRDRPQRHDPLPPNLNPEDGWPHWREEAERWIPRLPEPPASITHKAAARAAVTERTEERRARQERQAS